MPARLPRRVSTPQGQNYAAIARGTYGLPIASKHRLGLLVHTVSVAHELRGHRNNHSLTRTGGAWLVYRAVRLCQCLLHVGHEALDGAML